MVQEITLKPADAKAILAAEVETPPVDESLVKAYAEAMRAGAWGLNPVSLETVAD